MLPGSLEAGRVLLAPSNVKPQRVTVFLRAIRRIPQIISRWLMRVESRNALATLSDHVLRDIGLTRNDVDRQLLKPFWRE
jgi:uncharacterized protein YjiS (DUF1127 family)